MILVPLEYVSAAKSSRPKVSEKSILKNVSNFPPATLLKKTVAHMFSCEFCDIFKNTYYLEICERLLLSCYFSNLKIFCFHAIGLYQ